MTRINFGDFKFGPDRRPDRLRKEIAEQLVAYDLLTTITTNGFSGQHLAAVRGPSLEVIAEQDVYQRAGPGRVATVVYCRGSENGFIVLPSHESSLLEGLVAVIGKYACNVVVEKIDQLALNTKIPDMAVTDLLLYLLGTNVNQTVSYSTLGVFLKRNFYSAEHHSIRVGVSKLKRWLGENYEKLGIPEKPTITTSLKIGYSLRSSPEAVKKLWAERGMDPELWESA